MSVNLPNVRKLFVPDPEYVMFDADLKGADAGVVAAEAQDADLLNAFKCGVDLHDHNAAALWGSAYTSLSGAERKRKRKETKVAVHATNYGASARTVAVNLKWKIAEAEAFQDRWFRLHPGIREWHDRVERALQKDRTIFNRFGYRIIYFDRIDGLLPQALAWIPQSTVALVCLKGAIKLELHPDFLRPEFKGRPVQELTSLIERGVRVSYIEPLLQVHDSLVFQIPRSSVPSAEELKAALTVPVPYDPPLTLEWTIKRSEESWGSCREKGAV